MAETMELASVGEAGGVFGSVRLAMAETIGSVAVVFVALRAEVAFVRMGMMEPEGEAGAV